MRNRILALGVFVVLAALMVIAEEPAKKKDWSMNATIIEACSCPMFCQCYFSTQPAGHSHHAGAPEEHYCKFNNAFRVNKGTYGATKLDGAKFWVAGDLGGDFSKGKMDWAVLTFDPSVTAQQREGIVAVLGKLYPVEWNSFTVAADAPMEWNAAKETAVAKLDGGNRAEVALMRATSGMRGNAPVIKDLQYWGAPRNDGFVLMPNTVQAYRAGEKAFETKGTNGFMITFDISSKDVPAAGGM